ncbi:MAG: hypothetical protein HQL72_09430 [Magnetococcales bacterium]|nr:hypothetical protein [Magnetococcales bacterium]
MRRLLYLLPLCLVLNGCLLTKVVTEPLRIAGEVVGEIPVVGGGIEAVLDTTAGTVDLIPL